MTKTFLGRGWKFPIAVDDNGKIALSEYETDIREAIRLILLTAPGERVMRPEFGSGLHNFVFATMHATTLGALQAAVQNALIQWEPRIQVLSVQVTPDRSEIGRALIAIDYRVRATNTSSNLVFPFYLEEQG
jgi:phage baseplate assembly protein W